MLKRLTTAAKSGMACGGLKPKIGHLELGEDPIQGARRDFEEETGYFPRHIEQLGYYNQFPGVLQAATSLFFATGLVQTSQHLELGEVLETAHKPLAEVLGINP